MCGRCIGRRGVLAAALLRVARGGAAEARVEPRLVVAGAAVALTLDACPGGFDARIAEALIGAGIPVTVFASGLWLKWNPGALALLRAHPDLFGFGNHGALHLPPLLGEGTIYGLKIAGTLEALRRDVADGADALEAAVGVRPRWYRAPAGLYSPAALEEVRRMGFLIAGYSLNADFGASAPAASVAARMGRAAGGAVIIGHINQPHRESGAGIAAGALALQRAGTRFVRLDRLGAGDVVGG